MMDVSHSSLSVYQMTKSVNLLNRNMYVFHENQCTRSGQWMTLIDLLLQDSPCGLKHRHIIEPCVARR